MASDPGHARALYGAHVCRRACPGSPLLVLGTVTRRLPFFKLFAIAQIALLTHRHLTRLNGQERRRLAQLVAARPAAPGRPSGASSARSWASSSRGCSPSAPPTRSRRSRCRSAWPAAGGISSAPAPARPRGRG